MFSSRFIKHVAQNKSTWTAGLAIVVVGATFKVNKVFQLTLGGRSVTCNIDSFLPPSSNSMVRIGRIL